MSSRRRSMSLRVKWTVTLLAATLVPLSLVAVVSVRIQRRGLERAEKELEVAVVDEVATSIGDALGEVSETTHRVGRVLGDPRIASDDARLNLALEALARSDALESVAVYDATGHFIDAISHASANGGQPSGAGAAAPPLDLATTLVKSAAAAWLEETAPDGGTDLRYVEPMNYGGQVRGWVAGHLRPSALSRRVGQISRSRFVTSTRVLVVDSAFRVIATEAKGSLAPGRDLRGHDIFAAVPFGDGVWSKDFGLTTEFEDGDGVATVGTVRTMPERRWAVVVRRPESEAFAALAQARRAFLVAIGFVALIAVALGAWLARRTTAPIASLVALTRAYGRREFERQSDVRSGDELEELGGSLGDMATALASSEVEIARRATVEANLSRYLPAEAAKAVALGEKSLALGGERKEISVLFADVAAFTTFSERSSPENVVSFLNELFSILSEVVFRHGGMVDKFMGDCIMAVFAPPEPGDASGHARRAVAAAEDMHRFVETQASAWKRDYDFDVRLGIGLASGPALIGNLGSLQRMEYTAIGDTVNVASRLESLARPGQTLVTKSVSEAASPAFQFKSLGRHPVRGKQEALEIFELVV